MEIELICGRKVYVDGFEMGCTYTGLIEGKPNESINKNIFDQITYPLSWGERKVLKIKPTNDEFKRELKPNHYAAMLVSDESINEESNGSELVVIWFGEAPNGKSIEMIIEDGVKSIDWNANAEDFYF